MIPKDFMEWKACIEVKCGIPLTPTFVKQRLLELGDYQNQHTKEFIRVYGNTYHQQVIKWFEESLQMQKILS